ncbi:hypothetical protein EG327_007517 [Venturia inaequalis]|uniref:Uncharacterized protein n=1 Tax=Venturia inaequalis TaxID=5025 RepID=A0A8H3V0I2_VENIN|nr:hypothetical protein EG327_007517 [Venturia inaequalis]
MRLTSSTILSLLLLPSALAAPLDSRKDTAPPNIYEAETQRVNYELTTLSKHLESMARSRPSDRTNLAGLITSQSARIVSVSREGAQTMRTAPPPTFIQENELLNPIARLAFQTREIEKQWIAIRDIVFAMNGQQKVIQILKDSNQAAAEFSYAMNSKMTGISKEVGKVYADAVDGMVKNVIRAYERPKGGNPVGWF